MANNGTIITAPVQVTDVQTVLGETKSDVIGLCSSAKINNKSRFKPYNFGGVLAPIDKNEWDKAIKAQNFGMVPTYFVTQTNGASYTNPATTAKDAYWKQWQAPQGGEHQPYRLGDYNGYNKSAVPCINRLEIQGLYSNTPCFTVGNDSRRTPISALLHLNTSADIPLGDFHEHYKTTDFKDYYLTLLIGPNVSGLGNGCIIAQSQNTIGNSGAVAVVSLDTHVTSSVADEMRINSKKVIMVATLMPKIAQCAGGKTAYFSSLGSIGGNSFLSLKVYTDTNVSNQVLYATAKFTDTDSGSFPVKPAVQSYYIKTTFLRRAKIFDVEKNWNDEIVFRCTSNSAFTIAQFSKALPTETVTLNVRVKFLETGYASYDFNNGADLIFDWSGWHVTGNMLYAADNDSVQPMTFSPYSFSHPSGDVDVWVEVRIANYETTGAVYQFTTEDNGGTQAKSVAINTDTITLY